MSIMKIYDYLIIGAGSAGCSIAHFLKKYNKKLLFLVKKIFIILLLMMH